jgi:glycosyltransferase involved in cell wall biosynthesis
VASSQKKLKVALAHDYLNSWGGGERVLAIFKELYKEADVFAITHDPEKVKGHVDFPVHTSFLQKVPFAVKLHKWFLVLMPLAVHKMDFRGYDLILSDSSGFIKGLRAPKGALHVCYIHTSTRYLTVDKQYFKESVPRAAQWLVPPFLKWLAKIDRKDAQLPDVFIANSQETAKRVVKYYGRKPDAVIFPPVDTEAFYRKPSDKVEDFYLVAGRLVPYKRFDLAIAACNALGRKLVVIGAGPEEAALRELAGPTVEFRGKVSDEDLRQAYANCKAMLFPSLEDAGMTPLESMACGRPVIAYAMGGVLESVVEGKTGVFFKDQAVDSLTEVIKTFEKGTWNIGEITSHAKQFSKESFKEKVAAVIEKAQEKQRV